AVAEPVLTRVTSAARKRPSKTIRVGVTRRSRGPDWAPALAARARGEARAAATSRLDRFTEFHTFWSGIRERYGVGAGIPGRCLSGADPQSCAHGDSLGSARPQAARAAGSAG